MQTAMSNIYPLPAVARYDLIRQIPFITPPADSTVQRDGVHLNLEIHINRVGESNLHIPIDPNTVRPGDIL